MKTTRRNFDSDLKLHEMVAKPDTARPALRFIFFKSGFAYVSDSFGAMKIDLSTRSPFDFEERKRLSGYYMSDEKYKLVLSMDTVIVSEPGVLMCKKKGADIKINLDTKEALEGHMFPDIDALIRGRKNNIGGYEPFKCGDPIAYDMNLLVRIQRATGYETLVFTICTANAPSLLRPNDIADSSEIVISTERL